MDHKSFILYQSSEALISILSDEDCAKLTRGLFAYARTKVQPELPEAARIVFASIRQYMDENEKKWEETREKRSQAGKNSGKVRREAARRAAEQEEMLRDTAKDAADTAEPEEEDETGAEGTYLNTVHPGSTERTVSDSVSDFVSVSAHGSVPVSESENVSVSGSAAAPASVVSDAGGIGSDRWAQDNEWEQLIPSRQSRERTPLYSDEEQSRAEVRGDESPLFFEHAGERMSEAERAEPGAEKKEKDRFGTNDPLESQRMMRGAPAEESGPLYAIPRFEEVEAYCRTHRLYTDPERFFRINEENGWNVNGRPMRDWRAVLRGWSRKDEAAAARAASDPRREGRLYTQESAEPGTWERPLTPQEQHEREIEEWVKIAMERPFDERD